MGSTREEMQQMLTDILGNASDTANVSRLLNKIREDYDESLRTVESLNQQSATLHETNEKLIKQNMELFLQAGAKPDGESGSQNGDDGDAVDLSELIDPKTGRFKIK